MGGRRPRFVPAAPRGGGAGLTACLKSRCYPSWSSSCSSSTPTCCAPVDRLLYDSAGGPGWTRNDNWGGSAPICERNGVDVDLGRVHALCLNDNNLDGSLPESLGRLDALEFLSIGRKLHLGGLLPAPLASTALVHVQAFGSGTCVPPELARWAQEIGHDGVDCATGNAPAVNVLVAYAVAAGAAAGRFRGAEAEIVRMVAEANEALRLSGAVHSYRIVHILETPYRSIDTQTDLAKLAGRPDGFLDEIHRPRVESGADLVHLVFSAGKAPTPPGAPTWTEPSASPVYSAG